MITPEERAQNRAEVYRLTGVLNDMLRACRATGRERLNDEEEEEFDRITLEQQRLLARGI